MKKIVSIVIISFLLNLNLKAEVVKKILIDGNKRISSETVKLYGKIETDKDYKAKDLDKILKNLYETNFFEEVNIELTNNILKINLKEYPFINQIIIVGEKTKKFKDQIKKIINSKEKRSLIKSNLVKDVELIKSLYSSIGYNFSKVQTKKN